MASIYGNCVLEIAATASRSSEEGLFAERNRRLPRSNLLDAGSLCGSQSQVFVRGKHSSEFLVDMESPVSSRLYPLHSRGWTLQEHLLSPRILHCGPDEVLWECNEIITCCCDDKPTDHGFKNFFSKCLNGELKSSFLDREFEACWQLAITLYSSRLLTKPSDKLPAISGLAQRWKPSTSHSYLAGLWENDLIYGLTWYSTYTPACHRPSQYRAPSWSWAAIDGPVRFTEFPRPPREVAKSAIEILEAKVTLKSINPMGEVTAGHIKLLGALVETTYIFQAEPLENEDVYRRYSCERNGQVGTLVPDVSPEVEGLDYIELGTTIFCLKITHMVDMFGITKLLALRPSLSAPGVFVRVGLFRMKNGPERA